MPSVCKIRSFSGQGKWSVGRITARTFSKRWVTWLAIQLLACLCERCQAIEGRWSSTQHVCGHSAPHRTPRWRGFSTHLRSVGDWNAQHTRFNAYSNIFAGLTEVGVRLKPDTPTTFRLDFLCKNHTILIGLQLAMMSFGNGAMLGRAAFAWRKDKSIATSFIDNVNMIGGPRPAKNNYRASVSNALIYPTTISARLRWQIEFTFCISYYCARTVLTSTLTLVYLTSNSYTDSAN